LARRCDVPPSSLRLGENFDHPAWPGTLTYSVSLDIEFLENVFFAVASIVYVGGPVGKHSNFHLKYPIISIVDDDEVAREATADLVRSLGYGAVTFDSAERFLESAEPDDHPSCLITDLQMPGLNGLELQRHLIAAGRDIPVIFVTGHWQESTRQQALKAGAVAFLSKPFHEASLIESLEIALKKLKVTQ
jgi:CheY-like chemotaxis protein